MIHAYDETYLEQARTMLGTMLDFAVHDLKYNIQDFYTLFCESKFAKAFETGSSALIAGKSGVELAYDIVGNTKWILCSLLTVWIVYMRRKIRIPT